LFVDEIHRFNKAQQDAFLPHVEDGTVILLGATTENPSFELNAALLSRAQVEVLEPLAPEAVVGLLRRALTDRGRGLGHLELAADDDALARIADLARGDARTAYNLLETTAALVGERGRLTRDVVDEAIRASTLRYDKTGEQHFDTVSAFIKSLRGSDPDAGLYYLARMLEGGEDPRFIARRMVVFASEDVGNADPGALGVAVDVAQAVELVGLPEARINMAQAVTYLALAPKSNASYMGVNAALEAVRRHGPLPIPLHVRNAPTGLMKRLGYGAGYEYAHDQAGGVSGQRHLPDALAGARFYEPTDRGLEAELGRRLERLRALRGGRRERT
ncbi:MAG: replication-associated recombination protein A, partial [Planctomycetota bacterium]|nr:replication-associated recombination protein A [Planctomycetota bacterium]